MSTRALRTLLASTSILVLLLPATRVAAHGGGDFVAIHFGFEDFYFGYRYDHHLSQRPPRRHHHRRPWHGHPPHYWHYRGHAHRFHHGHGYRGYRHHGYRHGQRGRARHGGLGRDHTRRR